MAKSQNDSMLDAALAWLKTNMDAIKVCSSQPTTYSEAHSTYMLATAAHSISGSPANGDSSGRKIEVPVKNSTSVSSAGSADHVALTGSISSSQTLMYVTTCSTKALGASDKVNIPAWDIEIADAT
ncbi:hypothetical protein KAR91_23295 [Candidatus Pacearchaeota archaeon]|nr:hypothetical protein [Candidatus Pacearchaeota archaeon]